MVLQSRELIYEYILLSCSRYHLYFYTFVFDGSLCLDWHMLYPTYFKSWIWKAMQSICTHYTKILTKFGRNGLHDSKHVRMPRVMASPCELSSADLYTPGLEQYN